MQFVNEFRYLLHIISNNLCDDAVIKREIHNMYVRTNMSIQRFRNCSQHVKIAIFRDYCICLYLMSFLLTEGAVLIFNTSTIYKNTHTYTPVHIHYPGELVSER